jgi:hypothetical protein
MKTTRAILDAQSHVFHVTVPNYGPDAVEMFNDLTSDVKTSQCVHLVPAALDSVLGFLPYKVSNVVLDATASLPSVKPWLRKVFLETNTLAEGPLLVTVTACVRGSGGKTGSELVDDIVRFVGDMCKATKRDPPKILDVQCYRMAFVAMRIE